jgi:hypothetical protein
MVTVTNRHAYLRNATKGALTVHPSANPVPGTVAPGEVVRVDEWAGADLKASGFDKATAGEWVDPNVEAVAAQLDEHDEQHPDDTEDAGSEGDDDTEGDAS